VLDAGTLIGCTVTLVIAVIGATWALAAKINSVREGQAKDSLLLRTKLSEMETKLAVMNERESQRAEKIDQMWKWWLSSIEGGWIAHMKSQVEGAGRRGEP
jgi:hypothetical protein